LISCESALAGSQYCRSGKLFADGTDVEQVTDGIANIAIKTGLAIDVLDFRLSISDAF
jgi:hypothetical protein